MTVVLLRRGAARDATEFEDAHLVVVVAFLRLVGLVLFIFEDEDEAHAFASPSSLARSPPGSPRAFYPAGRRSVYEHGSP